MKRILSCVKREAVLSAAFALAVLSCFFVKPDKEYIGYLDMRVLVLLFCLMAVMEGFKQLGIFERLAKRLLDRVQDTRELGFVLVFLCFFSAMLITNDVALITFVPFTILLLQLAGKRERTIPIVVLQTIGANLGSMLTPIGNPQNLYLYTISEMRFGEFLLHMLPLTAVSFVLLAGCCMLQRRETVRLQAAGNEEGNTEERALARKSSGEGAEGKLGENGKGLLTLDSVLFLLSLLCVLRILPYPVLFAVVLVCILLFQREILKKVDYCLLLTFVSFFVFIGNMGRIETVQAFLAGILRGRELLVAFFSSQVISNVPAAILLSGFTDNYTEVLKGVNIGGLGTLIASLASLISYKFYAAAEDSKKGAYFLHFTKMNLIFAVILLLTAVFV